MSVLSSHMLPRAWILVMAGVSVLAVVLGLAFALTRPAATQSSAAGAAGAEAASSAGFDGAAVAGAPSHGFTLSEVGGGPVSLSQFRGQVTVLAFLYSSCGATCVLIAQQIRGALDELARPVPVLLISADPAADTPASVDRFLQSVSLRGRVHYLSGSQKQLQAVWRAYGTVAAASAGRAAFARFASVILLGESGRERVVFGQEQLTAEGLAHDIRKLS